ncbi:hypothetical protein [Neisseria meningitidis]|nr:hypothetical protein [Neisseria meningitidis]
MPKNQFRVITLGGFFPYRTIAVAQKQQTQQQSPHTVPARKYDKL